MGQSWCKVKIMDEIPGGLIEFQFPCNWKWRSALNWWLVVISVWLFSIYLGLFYENIEIWRCFNWIKSMNWGLPHWSCSAYQPKFLGSNVGWCIPKYWNLGNYSLDGLPSPSLSTKMEPKLVKWSWEVPKECLLSDVYFFLQVDKGSWSLLSLM